MGRDREGVENKTFHVSSRDMRIVCLRLKAWDTLPSRHVSSHKTQAGETLSSRHVSSHKTYVVFSTPSLSLPMRWLSYADLYNLVTWCHIKCLSAHFFNKHFLHFWKQLVTSEERSTRASRLTKCVRQQKF